MRCSAGSGSKIANRFGSHSKGISSLPPSFQQNQLNPPPTCCPLCHVSSGTSSPSSSVVGGPSRALGGPCCTATVEQQALPVNALSIYPLCSSHWASGWHACAHRHACANRHFTTSQLKLCAEAPWYLQRCPHSRKRSPARSQPQAPATPPTCGTLGGIVGGPSGPLCGVIRALRDIKPGRLTNWVASGRWTHLSQPG